MNGVDGMKQLMLNLVFKLYALLWAYSLSQGVFSSALESSVV
jgi:hypothetical protein